MIMILYNNALGQFYGATPHEELALHTYNVLWWLCHYTYFILLLSFSC